MMATCTLSFAPKTRCGCEMNVIPPRAARPAPVFALVLRKSRRVTAESFFIAAPSSWGSRLRMITPSRYHAKGRPSAASTKFVFARDLPEGSGFSVGCDPLAPSCSPEDASRGRERRNLLPYCSMVASRQVCSAQKKPTALVNQRVSEMRLARKSGNAYNI
jgi:hypothetical protein